MLANDENSINRRDAKMNLREFIGIDWKRHGLLVSVLLCAFASQALGQANQIVSVAPASAEPGTSNLTVTFTLPDSTPPTPPAEVSPTEMTIGSKRWEGSSREEAHARVLLLLWDYDRRVTPAREDGTAVDYRRSRLLWRVWHYERSGDEVSVDAFPGITYDRRGTEFRQTSFLWRLFRYQRSPEGRKLDLLFLPVVRTDAP